MMSVPHYQDTNVFLPPRQLAFRSLDSITTNPIAEYSSSQGQVLCHLPRQGQQAPLVEGIHLNVKLTPFDNKGWTVVTQHK